MKLYLIGNSHIDPVWLWNWHEGVAEVLATFRSALDRMKEFPDVKFTCACSSYYEWVEKMDPDMFEEIRQRIKEGRWEIVGGWYLQPDCNMPDGESFARHALVAQRYFKEKFGVTAKTGYNVDSFGHNANLPKILKQSGMDSYIFSRPSMKEQGNTEVLFVWESDDGSQVTAYRNPSNYNIDLGNHQVKLTDVKNLAEERGMDLMALYGVGNHGGGPTIQLIDAINGFDIGEKVYASPRDYFDKVDTHELLVIHDELQHHARGCYSAESTSKAAYRKCEQNLLAAETLCLMAEKLTGDKYPAKKLNKAWKNLLFNQFHDIMCGCSIKSAYKDAEYLFGEIMSVTEQAMVFAMQKIAWHIDTLQGETLPSYKKSMRVWEHEVLGTPVVVFNTHPWPVKAELQVSQMATKMTDKDGDEIPFQVVRGEHINGETDKFNTIFTAEVPAMGYTVYRLFAQEETKLTFENEFTQEETVLENSKIKAEFDKTTGDICYLYDKESQTVLIDKPMKAVLVDETHCDTWAHNEKDLGKTIGMFEKPEFKVLEDGPVRRILRVTTGYQDSTLQRDYILYAGSEEIKVRTKIDFHEKHRVLKFTFPMCEETVTTKIPYGTITRKGYTGEEPCGSWMASGKLCVANDSKYGYDTENGEMRMSVLRSAIYADHYGQIQRDEFCEYMEQGIHEFTYSIFPFTANAEAERKASVLNFGLRHNMGSFRAGKLSEEYCGFACDNDAVIVSAIKKSEDGKDAIARLYEMNDTDAEVSMKLFDKEIKTTLTHNQVKTLDENGNELDMMEWKL
ncbi:MAG: alpha-mannosidase [Clostridia bacterium]|nr:alpha-mannosidase [Clostridia bacterium]